MTDNKPVKAPSTRAEPEPAPKPTPKPTPKDPWTEHCPVCGLLGCRAGHT